MTAPAVARQAPVGDEISLIGLANTLLRWRRIIIVLGLLGASIGLAKGLSNPRVFRSTATFIPQGSDGPASGLAAAAGQLGFRVASSSWGPSMYVEVLRSRALLEPLAHDTVTVPEQGGRRVSLMDLLNVEAGSAQLRTDRALQALQGLIESREVQTLGAVEVSAKTPWPSVSLALAERAVEAVNRFTIDTRKSQAQAERRFIEVQARESESALRIAEDRLQEFLERNRSTGSPDLAFAKDRLQREVTLRQQLYTSLLQSLDEARIREVRDIPVITVIEAPRMPLQGEPRGAGKLALLGGLAGGMIGVLIAFLGQALVGASHQMTDESREFLRLVHEAKPRFFRR